MKRTDFYRIVTESCRGEKVFEMTYRKVNGDTRKAVCKLHDSEIDKTLKGNGLHRHDKMERNNVFQYFDVNSNAYRSAKIENIMDVTIDGVLHKIEN